MNRDVVLGSILLATSATYYLMTSAIPESQLADAVGAKGAPSIYAALLAGLSLLLIARAVMARRGVRAIAADERTDGPPRTVGRELGMLAIGVIYILFVPVAGYVLSIAALIVGTAYYQGGRVTRQVLLVGTTGAVLLWLVFVVLLRIPQPAGIWSALW